MFFNICNNACLFSCDKLFTLLISSSSFSCSSLKNSDKVIPNAPHIAGMAIDIDSGQANWMAENGLLEECGLYRPLLNWGASGGTNEPWHIEITEWRTNGRDTELVMGLTS